jgi:hypothetical protein
MTMLYVKICRKTEKNDNNFHFSQSTNTSGNSSLGYLKTPADALLGGKFSIKTDHQSRRINSL